LTVSWSVCTIRKTKASDSSKRDFPSGRESDESISLGESREILRSVLNRMYDGPQAGLVRVNLVIGCLALTPVFLILVVVLAGVAGQVLGDWIMIPSLIATLLLAGIGEAPFLVMIPFLIAVIFLRRLLQSQEIPPQIKKQTALFVKVALVLMFASAGLLYLAYRAGRAKGLFS